MGSEAFMWVFCLVYIARTLRTKPADLPLPLCLPSFQLDSDLTQPVPSMLILTFTLISHAFSRHAFVGTPLPAVKIEFQERLQNISVDLIRVQNHTAPGPSSVDLENGASLLLALSAGKRVTMVQDLEEGAHSHWNTCDALEMGGELNGRCVKSEEGEEMMACGRASLGSVVFTFARSRTNPSCFRLTVSSCEILLERCVRSLASLLPPVTFPLQLLEHQRLHWKQHKVGCFAPKW
ncbi:hypothetical protein BDY24DRAFT_55538 [Mrakia frigida]|uniref:uncharacterized protein n=1 Tax=Mrakia frigida TaxID=29902 RepID=UPI003FCC2601